MTDTAVEYRPFGRDTWRDPYPLYRRLRDEDPVHRSPAGYWVLTRFQHVFDAARDTATFSSAHGLTFDDEGANLGVQTMVFMDPPEHTRYRRLVSRGFTPRNVEALEPALRARVRAHVQALRESGSGDFVAGLARPIPSWVVAHYLGVPEVDRFRFDEWTQAIVQASYDAGMTAAGAVADLSTYFVGLVEAKRHSPGDDVVSDLIRADDEGHGIGLEGILGMAFVMIAGGNDTTTGLLAGAAELLTEHPDQRQRLLDDPSLIPNAVDELLRLTSPVQGLCRVALRDVGARRHRDRSRRSCAALLRVRQPGRARVRARLRSARRRAPHQRGSSRSAWARTTASVRRRPGCRVASCSKSSCARASLHRRRRRRCVRRRWLHSSVRVAAVRCRLGVATRVTTTTRVATRRCSRAKAALRERVWADLDQPGVARFPKPANRIPNFVGAEAAARRLAETPEWAAAATVKSNPDSPQWPVRQRALVDGKIVYMAVPRLAEANPFFLLDPAQLADNPRTASSIKGASRSARTVDVDELEPVDLVVTGCVAVDESGRTPGQGRRLQRPRARGGGRGRARRRAHGRRHDRALAAGARRGRGTHDRTTTSTSTSS